MYREVKEERKGHRERAQGKSREENESRRCEMTLFQITPTGGQAGGVMSSVWAGPVLFVGQDSSLFDAMCIIRLTQGVRASYHTLPLPLLTWA